MKFLKAVPVLGATVLICVSNLSAQTCNTTPACTVTNTASATVTIVARLTLNVAATDLGTPVQADFTTGSKDAVGPIATVLANTAWRVSVVGNTGTFSCTGTGCRAAKPASDLLWGTVAGTYGNNAGASATLVSGTGTAGTVQPSFYRTNWALAADTPGVYTLVLNYTLSEP